MLFLSFEVCMMLTRELEIATVIGTQTLPLFITTNRIDGLIVDVGGWETDIGPQNSLTLINTCLKGVRHTISRLIKTLY